MKSSFEAKYCLAMVVKEISSLFNTVKTLFNL